MMPRQVPLYSPALAAGAPPGYGQPGFYPSNPAPQAQGLPVQVGIPAGVPVQAFPHVANAGVGNIPFSTINQQTHFVQGQQNNFVHGARPNDAHAAPPNTSLWQGQQPEAPCSPPPSSFPPGFEPGHNKSLPMGFPSQPRPNTVATGGPVMHPDQHHVHHQHQHVNQHEYQQHQRQYHHQQQQHQPQHQYQHQQHQNQQQQQQHQYQPQHQHHYQHQHHQNQRSNQHQRQHQLEHKREHHQQHQVQQQDHYQQNHQSHAHSQLNMQAQQYKNPHPHSHPHLQQQNQPHPVQLQTWPQPQAQAQAQAQLQTPSQPPQFQTVPQPQVQAQPACQQVQLLPTPFSSSLHACPANIQADCANGVAIGLPVMPTSSHVDTTVAQTVVQIQQTAPAWHQGYPENSLQCALQSSNTSFAFSNKVQDNSPQVVAPEKDHHSNGRQPTNIQRNDYSNVERRTDPLREDAQVMPQMNPDSQLHAEATKPSDAQRIDQMWSNDHLATGASHPSSFIGNNHRHWLLSPKSQIPTWVNGRNPFNVLRSFQPHMNGPFSVAAQKCNNGQQVSQLQKKCDSRGNKDVQKRSGMQVVRCDPCDRTFNSSEILGLHLKTHVKCGEEGCTFEASGKIVKEHKVTEHGKVEIQATYRGRKALALRSMEDEEDIKRWREERKKSYPTSANILRKAEDRKRKEAEGEFFDEEREKRRQRMRDVISRQKQLGFQVPEIPSHYFYTRYDRRPKNMVRQESAIADVTDGKTESVERRNLAGLKRAADDMETSIKVVDLKNDNQTIEPSNDENEYRRKGHIRKGHHNKFSSRHEGRKRYQKYETNMARPRPPTLLSRLLNDDIQKENSYLMQCCRFIVNNAFLQDYSPSSLKHFEWIEAAMPTIGDGSSVDVIDSKAQLKSEREEMLIHLESEIPACKNEGIILSDSKDTGHEAEKKVNEMGDTGFVICKPSLSNNKDFVTDRKTKDVPRVSVTFPQKHGRKNQEQDPVHEEPPERNLSQPSHKNDSGKAESKLDCTTQHLSLDCQPREHPHAFLESNDSQLKHFAVEKVVRSVNTFVSSGKSTSTITHLSDDDMEAGEVVSEHSESIVEDEEDISQYMNFDANGADSGSCYD